VRSSPIPERSGIGTAETTGPGRDDQRARRPVRRLSTAAVERFGLRLVLVSAAVALVAVPFNLLTFAVVGEGEITRWDGQIAADLNHFVSRNAVLADSLELVSWLGRPPTLWALVTVGVVALWRQGRVRLLPFVIVTPLLGSLVNTAVKLTVDRERPVVDDPIITPFGTSYPSGHAFLSVVVYGVLLVAFLPMVPEPGRQWVWRAVAVLVVAIGASRVLLGVHFVSDVIAGFVLGVAFLLAAIAAFKTWSKRESGSN
jgi:undecaprenyl-diphosphatase